MVLLKKALFLIFLILLLWPAPSFALKPAAGLLLVAREQMIDPRFQGTVILLLRHDDGGSLGLILNRPTHLSLEESFPQFDIFDKRDQLLWLGGPVSPKSALVLMATLQPPEGVKTLFAGVHVTGVRQLLLWLDEAEGSGRYRVYAGSAGWAPGQLVNELRRGDWVLKPADPATIFGHPGKMWERQEQRPGPLLIRVEDRLKAGSRKQVAVTSDQ